MTRAQETSDEFKEIALMSLTEKESQTQCIAELAIANIISNECNDEVASESVGKGVDVIVDELNPTKTLWTALAKAFDHFNEHLFGSELDPSKVMLNASRRSHAAGFYWPGTWTAKEGVNTGTSLDEISINPDYMSHTTDKDILSTLVHEMAHMWQQHFGKPSKKGYHNKEWANKMEEVGLMPSATGMPGGKKTGPRMTHYIIEGGVFEQAYNNMPEDLKKLPFLGQNVNGPKKKVGYHKFVCTQDGCRQVVRGKESVKIACAPCSVAAGKLVLMVGRGQ
jgi:hypothetical protein